MKNEVSTKLVKHLKSQSMVALVREDNHVYAMGAAGAGTLFEQNFPSNAKAKEFLNGTNQI